MINLYSSGNELSEGDVIIVTYIVVQNLMMGIAIEFGGIIMSNIRNY